VKQGEYNHYARITIAIIRHPVKSKPDLMTYPGKIKKGPFNEPPDIIAFWYFLFLSGNMIPVAVHEFINPSCSVDKLHLAGIERMGGI